MSSFPNSLIRCRTSFVMVLAGIVALSFGNGTARSQLINSANGQQFFRSTDLALAANGTTDIAIGANVVGSSGLYDANGVVYLRGAAAGAASSVTAQYFVGGVAQGPAFNVSLNSGTSTTIAAPQQFTSQAGSVPVILRVTNGATGNGVTVGAGSGLTVTGYTQNGDGPTAVVPGSGNLAATGATFTPTVVVNAPNATGLFSLNSAITVINTAAGGAQQTISGRYTVDTVATGPTFTMTLPAGTGSTTLMSLPTQLTLSAGTHTIGFAVTDNSGLGINVKAGSTISATAYNNSGGTSAVGVTNANQFPNPNNPLSIPFGGTAPSGLTVVVPPTTNATLFDANASFMILSQGAASQITAQFTLNNALIGQVFTLDLGATGTTSTLSMMQQFASLTSGGTLGIQFGANGSATLIVEADSLALVAHQQVQTVGVPEPASLSMAAMAALAFGGAAYRKRRNAKKAS